MKWRLELAVRIQSTSRTSSAHFYALVCSSRILTQCTTPYLFPLRALSFPFGRGLSPTGPQLHLRLRPIRMDAERPATVQCSLERAPRNARRALRHPAHRMRRATPTKCVPWTHQKLPEKEGNAPGERMGGTSTFEPGPHARSSMCPPTKPGMYTCTAHSILGLFCLATRWD